MYALCMHNLECVVQTANEGVLAKRNCERDLGICWDILSKRQEKSHHFLLVMVVHMLLRIT